MLSECFVTFVLKIVVQFAFFFKKFLYTSVLWLESCANEVLYQFILYLVYVCFLIYFANKVWNFFHIVCSHIWFSLFVKSVWIKSSSMCWVEFLINVMFNENYLKVLALMFNIMKNILDHHPQPVRIDCFSIHYDYSFYFYYFMLK